MFYYIIICSTRWDTNYVVSVSDTKRRLLYKNSILPDTAISANTDNLSKINKNWPVEVEQCSHCIIAEPYRK